MSTHRLMNYLYYGLGGLMVAALPMQQVQAAVVVYNSGDVNTSGFWKRYSYPYSYNVQNWTSYPTRSGNQAMRFEVRYGTRDAEQTYHAEIVKSNVQALNQVRWYGFSVYVPAVYDLDGVVVFQLFDWSSGGSGSSFGPPLMFYTRTDGWGVTPHWDGGGKLSVKIANSIEADRWTDWVLEVKASSGTDGYIRAWKNGVQVTGEGQPSGYAYRGRIGYSSTRALETHHGVYATKWNYRPPPGTGTKQIAVAYIDEIRYGDANSNYDEVRPR